MKSNNQLIRKENLISIVVILLFVLGFFILINNTSITGYTALDNSTIQSENFTFGIEAVDTTVQLQAPVNGSNESLQIEFIYNVSSDVLINNCSLYLDIDGAGFMNNVTLDQNYTKQVNNLSSGFSTATLLKSTSPVDITTNGTDFWIVGWDDDWIYHTSLNGTNYSDGFDTLSFGSTDSRGITTNSTDFWITDAIDDLFVYHVNASGDNQTDGFKTVVTGVSNSPNSITTNGTDFWIVDYADSYIYHHNASGDNQTDGFSTTTLGSNNPYAITTNGSDFWITDIIDNWVYHTNKSGYNFSDGFSTAVFGSESPYGITTSSFNMSLVNPGGTPTEFWIVDIFDGYVYHIKISLEEIVNQTIIINFDGEYSIDWKVGCYDNNTDQTNSSIRTLTIDTTPPTVNITLPKNNTNSRSEYINFTYNVTDAYLDIDSCVLWLYKSGAWELNFTDSSITETINQTINLTIEDGLDTLWKVECNDTVNNRGNSSIFNLTVNKPPIVDLQAPANDTTQRTLQINFIYNVSTIGEYIKNCSLLLNIDNEGFNDNITLHEDYIGDLSLNIILNQTDGFSTLISGSDSPVGITTNGSDFWIVDWQNDDFVYHTNKSGYNFSDGFSTIPLGSVAPYGITTNGSDFWIIDYINDDFVYHVNSTGDNQTDGFSALALGSDILVGITTNGTDFWLVDTGDKFVYHVNSSGDNQTDGFSTLPTGSDLPYGITTNGSDFWITDITDKFVYHVNSTGDNQTDGFSALALGSDNSMDITTSSFIMAENGGGTPKEFWIVDNTDKFAYHIKFPVKEIINQSITMNFDGEKIIEWKVQCYDDDYVPQNSSIYTFKINEDQVITLIEPTNNSRTTDASITFEYNVTDPDNDIDNCTLYHSLNNTVYTNVSIDNETINETITNSFSETIDNKITYQLYWKIGCYTNDTYQLNSTENTLITTQTTVIAGAGGGGGGTIYKNLTQYENITQPVYIFLPAPTGDENAKYVIQKIDLAKMNMDPNFQKLMGSAIFEIDIDDISPDKVIGTIGETMYITIGKEAKIDIDTSQERTRIAIRDILKEGLQKPKIPSLLWQDIKTLLLLIFLITSIFFSASKIYPNLPQIKDFVKNRLFKLIITGALFRFSRLSKKIPTQKGPVIVKFEQKLQKQKSSIIFKEPKKASITIETLKQDTVKTSKITNNKIKAFNKVHDLIIQDINKNKLDLASRRYEELLKIYNYLILRLNKQEQILIYQDFKEIYNELNNAIEIHFLKKKLK